MSVADQYEVLELIGRGSFGQIRKVRRRSDGHILVRKEIAYHRMSDKEKLQLSAECKILAQLKHPNIVEYYSQEHVKSDSSLHLYMEYCGNGDLSKTIEKCRKDGRLLPEQVIWSYFTQIILALYRCHNGVMPPAVGNVWEPKSRPRVPGGGKGPKILHRDLKPENIFLGQDNDVKLGDFGLSKMLAPEQHLANTYVGTPYYMSPEIVSDLSYTHKSDIWSLGCIIYELCQLSPPFNAKTQWSLIDKIKAGKFAPIPKEYSIELRRVIDLCLKVDPRERPDTAELLEFDVFRLMRKERELVLFRRELQSMEDQIKMREETVARKEQQLIREVARLQEEYDTRSMQLHHEIDAALRQKWEELAQQEIQKQVECQVEMRIQLELAARLQAEVERVIEEYDLVPRTHRELTPPATASLGSSGTSSGLSSGVADSPPRHPINRFLLVPDSPADITMASPSAVTPYRPNRMLVDGPPKYGQMLPPETIKRPNFTQMPASAPILPIGKRPITPCRSTSSHTPMLRDIANEPDMESLQQDWQVGNKRTASAYPNGSPTRQAPTRRRGLDRAGTTGLLPNTADKKEAFGLGGRGNSRDDVATAREGVSGSMVKAMSLVEIQKSRKQQKQTGPAAQWDRESGDCPSPFLRKNTRRGR